MTFSETLKNELSKVIDAPRHCRLAELAGIVYMLGISKIPEEGSGEPTESGWEIAADSILPLETAAELMRKLFSFQILPEKRGRKAGGKYSLVIPGENGAEKLPGALKLEEALPAALKAEKPGEIVQSCGLEKKQPDEKNAAAEPAEKKTGEGETKKELLYPRPELFTMKSCCKRAFLRGAFISAGTVSDPERYYHLEFYCREVFQAESLKKLIGELKGSAKVSKRGRYYLAYIKESEAISEMCALMGARISLLELENTRILRQMRGNVNRRVNCETANIEKTAQASARQIEDIVYIRDTLGFRTLSNGLDEIARLRLEYPEATLEELGSLLDPPVGKSGVNHRLRKLGKIAEAARREGGL